MVTVLCMLLCKVLAVLRGVGKDAFGHLGPQPVSGAWRGRPGFASGTFRTPVTVGGSYFLSITRISSSRTKWEELCVWRAMSGIHWCAPLSKSRSHAGSVFLLRCVAYNSIGRKLYNEVPLFPQFFADLAWVPSCFGFSLFARGPGGLSHLSAFCFSFFVNKIVIVFIFLFYCIYRGG